MREFSRTITFHRDREGRSYVDSTIESADCFLGPDGQVGDLCSPDDFRPVKVVSADFRDAYESTIGALSALPGCPQCRSLDLMRELMRGIYAPASDDHMGRLTACRCVLRDPHECGKPTRMVYLAKGDS